MDRDSSSKAPYMLAFAALEGARKFYAANPGHRRREKTPMAQENAKKVLTFGEQLSIFTAAGNWSFPETE